MHKLALGEFQPDLTVILDLPVAQGLDRAGGRASAENRYERMDGGFHERMRQGFSVFVIGWGERGFSTIDIGRRVSGR